MTRVRESLIALGIGVAVLLANGTRTHAQDAPTMAQTTAWLETEAPPLLARPTATSQARVEVQVTNCVLLLTVHERFTSADGIHQNVATRSIPLKDLDIPSIAVDTHVGYGQDTAGSPLASDVVLHTTPAAGKSLGATRVPEGSPSPAPVSMTDRLALETRDAAAATRLVSAFQRAATLCGAQTSAF